MERHGEKSAKVEMFEQKVYERLLNVCCRSAVGKGFGGSIMNNHGSNKPNWTAWPTVAQQVQVVDQTTQSTEMP